MPQPRMVDMADPDLWSLPDEVRGTTIGASQLNFVVLYRNFRSLPFLGSLGFLIRQLKV